MDVMKLTGDKKVSWRQPLTSPISSSSRDKRTSSSSKRRKHPDKEEKENDKVLDKHRLKSYQ